MRLLRLVQNWVICYVKFSIWAHSMSALNWPTLLRFTQSVCTCHYSRLSYYRGCLIVCPPNCIVCWRCSCRHEEAKLRGIKVLIMLDCRTWIDHKGIPPLLALNMYWFISAKRMFWFYSYIKTHFQSICELVNPKDVLLYVDQIQLISITKHTKINCKNFYCQIGLAVQWPILLSTL